MIKRSLDERDGIIFVTATGVWTVADVDQHYDALDRMIAALRKADRLVRVLSDITQAERQAPAIEAHIGERIARTYQPGDRVAMLVADADDKTLVRGLLGNADVATFSSRLPAEMWLMEATLKRPA